MDPHALITDYLATHQPTALYRTARRDWRPIVTRGPGRNTDSRHDRARQLVRSSVVVSRLWLPDGAADALAAHPAARPIRGFSTIDSGGQISSSTGWWRIDLAAVGLPDVDELTVRREVAAWFAELRANAPAPRRRPA